jgi:hypothetical protein
MGCTKDDKFVRCLIYTFEKIVKFLDVVEALSLVFLSGQDMVLHDSIPYQQWLIELVLSDMVHQFIMLEYIGLRT